MRFPARHIYNLIMRENVKPYEEMTDQERARFEQEHFDRLSPEQKFRVAAGDFSRGQPLNGEKGAIIDCAYGNGDGVFDNKDRELIEKERNDMGPLKILGGAVEGIIVLSDKSRCIVTAFELGRENSLKEIFAANVFGPATHQIPGIPAPAAKSQASSGAILHWIP